MSVTDILLVVGGIAAIVVVAVLVYVIVVFGIVRHTMKKMMDK